MDYHHHFALWLLIIFIFPPFLALANSITPWPSTPSSSSTTTPGPWDYGALQEWIYFDGTHCRQGKTPEEAKNTNTTENVINGKVIVKDQPRIPKNWAELDQMTMTPECGAENYELFTYCAKVNFFGTKGIQFAREHLLNRSNGTNPSSPEEWESMGYMQDMVLLLLDGCVECTGAKRVEVNLYLEQYLPKGPIPMVCPETTVIRSVRTMELDRHGYGNFVTGAILFERLCPDRPSENDTYKMAIPSYVYKQTRLIVEHNCSKDNVTQFKINLTLTLPDIDLKRNKTIKDHVLEFRHINISLDTLSDTMDGELHWDLENATDEQLMGQPATKIKPTPPTCGQRSLNDTEEFLIARGEMVQDMRKWPWLAVILQQDDDDTDKPDQICTASIIAPNYLLTASHCFDDVTPENIFTIVIGAVNHNSSNFNEKEPQQRIRIKNYIRHPEYVRRENNYNNFKSKIREIVKSGQELEDKRHEIRKLVDEYNGTESIGAVGSDDIALVELAKPVEYTDTVRPICLPKNTRHREYSMENAPLNIAGWGNIAHDQDIVGAKRSRPKWMSMEEEFLHEAIVNVHNCPMSLKVDSFFPEVSLDGEQRLADHYVINQISDLTMKVIAEDLGRRFFCVLGKAPDYPNIGSGDSGGPLMVKKRCCWEQAGVACKIYLRESKKDKYKAAQYTRVSYYCDWIESETGGSAKCR